MSRCSSACAAVGVGEENRERRRAAAAAGALPHPAADLGSPLLLRAGSELPWHRMALVGITVHLQHHRAPSPSCCPRSRVMVVLACWWVDAQAGLHLDTLVQKPSVHLPTPERGGSWCLGSPQGAVEEFFQSKGWIFVAATLKPAFKLRLSVV